MNSKENNSNPWSPYHLGLIAYFCILLPGGFLFAENYSRLGLPQRKRWFQLISIVWFLCFIALVVWLPENLAWLAELVHISFPVFMILLQNPAWQRWRDETDDELPRASLLKPIVLSVFFALTLFAGIAAKDWYLQYRLQQEMSMAQDAFMQGHYDQSNAILNKLIQDYPDERVVYINLALSQDAAGNRDSAIRVLDSWLDRARHDKEAGDMLYTLRYGRTNE